MKKIISILPLFAISLIFSTTTNASEGHHGRHGHHNKHRQVYAQGGYYPQASYAQPQYQDPRSHQGLAGGVIGSALGYEMGNGNPLASGLGAAAGSYLGNKIAGGR